MMNNDDCDENINVLITNVSFVLLVSDFFLRQQLGLTKRGLLLMFDYSYFVKLLFTVNDKLICLMLLFFKLKF